MAPPPLARTSCNAYCIPDSVYPFGKMSKAIGRPVEESFGTPARGGAHADPSPLPSISVVVPVYNSAQTLEPLVERLSTVLSTCSRTYEIILVDDGSKDTSWDAITNLAKNRNECRGLGLTRNYGQHNAVLAGVRSARYEVVVTIDDDLQNPPEEIPTLLAGLTSDTDVVYGAPRGAGHGIARRLSSRVTKQILKGVMGAEVATKVSVFRALRTMLRDGFSDAGGPTISIDVLLSWSTTRFQSVSVAPQQKSRRTFELHFPSAGPSRGQHVDRIQYSTPPAG